MKRFIMISFAFLGWGFYELSGGDEFEPASVRMAAAKPVTESPLEAEPAPQTEETAQPTAERAVLAAAIVDTTPPPVTPTAPARVSLSQNTDTASIREPAPDAPAAQPAATDTGVPQNVDVPQTAGSVISSADTPAIIPSLIAPEAQPAQVNSGYTGDIRRVSGSRVNVRGGPGTTYGVVTKLLRGDEVEILQDNGDGWVLMRPLDGGPEGWMADFLLTTS